MRMIATAVIFITAPGCSTRFPQAQTTCPEAPAAPPAPSSPPVSAASLFSAGEKVFARGELGPQRPIVKSFEDLFRKRRITGHIIGPLNWEPAIPFPAVPSPPRQSSGLDQELWKARTNLSVGYLSLPGSLENKRCVGWLYKNDLVVTNAHCVKNDDEAKDAQISFDYYSDVPGNVLVWYPCTALKQVWEGDDVAVLQCSEVDGRLPGQVYGTLSLSKSDPKPKDEIYVVHQNCNYYTDAACDPIKLSSKGQVSGEEDAQKFEFSHTADTLEGSSGAPVLSGSSYLVVGMHHSGCTKKNDCGKTATNGKGQYNFAIRASTLKSDLDQL